MTADPPTLDEYDLLRRAGRWVALSASEAVVVRLLLARFGRAVSRDRLMAALWPRDHAPSARLTQLMIRVRRRLAPLGLEVRTIRGHGYLLRLIDA